MGEILNELSNPLWWFSVVGAGIAINLISSYLKALLDKYLTVTASWWATATARRRSALKKYVERLASDPNAMAAARHKELRERIQASLHLVGSLSCLVLALLSALFVEGHPRWLVIFFLALFAVTFFLAYSVWFDGVFRGKSIDAASQKQAQHIDNKS